MAPNSEIDFTIWGNIYLHVNEVLDKVKKNKDSDHFKNLLLGTEIKKSELRMIHNLFIRLKLLFQDYYLCKRNHDQPHLKISSRKADLKKIMNLSEELFILLRSSHCVPQDLHREAVDELAMGINGALTMSREFSGMFRANGVTKKSNFLNMLLYINRLSQKILNDGLRENKAIYKTGKNENGKKVKILIGHEEVRTHKGGRPTKFAEAHLINEATWVVSYYWARKHCVEKDFKKLQSAINDFPRKRNIFIRECFKILEIPFEKNSTLNKRIQRTLAQDANDRKGSQIDKFPDEASIEAHLERARNKANFFLPSLSLWGRGTKAEDTP